MTHFFVAAISIATVLLYGCVGEIITEKAGHLNLGIPGIMCMGTAGGCLGVSLYMGSLSSSENASWILLILISLVFSVIFAALLGGVYALLTVTLRCNQNITGLAITIFGSGATNFLMHSFIDRTHFEAAGKIVSASLPFADRLGGFYYIMDYIKGSWENAGTIEAFGWLAIALVIFVLWKPNLAVLGALLFGACFIMYAIVNITPTQKEIIKMLPYVVTIVVLVLTIIRKKREHQPPASLGLSYFREDR